MPKIWNRDTKQFDEWPWDMELGKPYFPPEVSPPAQHDLDMISSPPHYKSHPSGIECIEITRHMCFNTGNAVKYILRHKHKNGKEDIRKAVWYLEDYLRHYPDDKTS